MSPLDTFSQSSAAEPRLIDYLRMVVRRRWLIGGGVAATLLVGIGAVALMPSLYRSTATIMVVQPKLGEPATNLPVLFGTYRALLDEGTLLRYVLTDSDIGKPPHSLRPEDVLVRFEEVPGTAVLRIHVSLKDPVFAATVANLMAERAVQLNQELSQDEAVRARDNLGVLLDQNKKKLEQAEAALLKFRTEAQVDVRKKDAEAILRERGQLLSLVVEIASDKARLARSETELSVQPRVLDVPRLSSEEGSLMAAARSEQHDVAKKDSRIVVGGASAVSPIGLDSTSEFVNPVHEALQYQVSMSRSRLAALEKQESELIGRRKLNSSEIPLLSELYARETGLAHLEMEWDIAKKTYQDLSLRFEQARTQVATRSSQLQIVGRAVPPESHESPRTLPILFGALVFGIVAFTGLALFVEYIATMNSLDNWRSADDKRS